jgi:hypothetical protein
MYMVFVKVNLANIKRNPIDSVRVSQETLYF